MRPRLRDRLAWVAGNRPQRLVLDLGTSDHFTEELLTVIAAAREQFPAGCLLETRCASPAGTLLELAGWPSLRVIAARQEAEPARLNGKRRV